MAAQTFVLTQTPTLILNYNSSCTDRQERV